MALSIKSAEADRLARELAAATGESLTEAVVTSLRERLERQRRAPDLATRFRRLADELRELPTLDDRTPEAIIGYDERGVPR